MEVLVRWFAEDVAQVADDRHHLEALGQALADLRARARKSRRRRRQPAEEAS